jgi:hypothetical protein
VGVALRRAALWRRMLRSLEMGETRPPNWASPGILLGETAQLLSHKARRGTRHNRFLSAHADKAPPQFQRAIDPSVLTRTNHGQAAPNATFLCLPSRIHRRTWCPRDKPSCAGAQYAHTHPPLIPPPLSLSLSLSLSFNLLYLLVHGTALPLCNCLCSSDC